MRWQIVNRSMIETENSVFVVLDTSVLLGLFDREDMWHAPATALVQALEQNERILFYLDCVLAEMMSTLARRLHEKRRDADLDELLSQVMVRCPVEQITWVLPDVPALYPEIVEQIRTSGGELNFNDALIALSCHNRGIGCIASFDRDFDRLSWMQRLATPADI
jgi:predicted nucleic acid-binding protein